MKPTKVFIAVAALAALGGLAACDSSSNGNAEIAPAVPEPTPGPVAQSDALNGTYNLRQADCGNVSSPTRLVIDGSSFTFPQTSCTVANSEKQVDRTRVTLACSGSPEAGNRIVDLQVTRNGTLRMTEDETTVTYFQCMKAAASSDALVGRSM